MVIKMKFKNIFLLILINSYLLIGSEYKQSEEDLHVEIQDMISSLLCVLNTTHPKIGAVAMIELLVIFCVNMDVRKEEWMTEMEVAWDFYNPISARPQEKRNDFIETLLCPLTDVKGILQN